MSSNRSEFIRMFDLMTIADDYESFGHISDLVSKHAMQSGLRMDRPQILNALNSLVEVGLAKAYRYRPPTNSFEEIQGMPPEEEIADPWHTYFWITEKGKDFLFANRQQYWPFDDLGSIRKDWSPPED
jgi:hypothetical protein